MMVGEVRPMVTGTVYSSHDSFGAATHLPSQCGKTVCCQWPLSKLLHICIHLLLNYTQNVVVLQHA